jgi:hypothetical protein
MPLLPSYRVLELIKCLDIRTEITLLGYWCFDRVFLLGEGWQSKAGCQPD